ncbi:hypothetical protein SH591_08795 [Sphingomonas sp. LY54]|uniref:hypothetical protein n=1 Tax=Sphingomonas sp. LY54 TaxID=3095343 RepID=UPI002D7907BA|nr:hypothetical protein [Sphingomonas sp. LY54]WRP27221.1 hypothetical protein SH591_08795 [Sphingomonas sp. LY54]
MGMMGAIRAGLWVAFVPTAALALFFVSYALLYPSFWMDNIPIELKFFQLAAAALPTLIAILLFRGSLFSRTHDIAALLLLLAAAEMSFVLPSIYRSLGQF